MAEKTAKFGPKSAFLVILGQILPFFAHFVQCLTKKQCEKDAFLVNLGQAMQAYSVPCWWVGWWFWRAGCIWKTPIYFIIIIIIINSKWSNVRNCPKYPNGPNWYYGFLCQNFQNRIFFWYTLYVVESSIIENLYI